MTELLSKWPVTLHTLAAGSVFCHTFETKYGPLSPNPVCKTRFALPGPGPNDPNTRAAFYIADSAVAALWEVVLRGVRPNARNGVYVSPADYLGRSIVTLTTKLDIPLVMRVDRPHRYRLVDADSPGDTAWDMCLTLAVHDLSHGAAHAVDRSLAGHGIQHAGLGWKSKQYPDGTVYLLYAPPFEEGQWTVGEIIDLTSPQGILLIRQAVEAAGYIWLSSPDEVPLEPELPDP